MEAHCSVAFYEKISSNHSRHRFPCCITLHLAWHWHGSPLKRLNPFHQGNQDMHAAFAPMAATKQHMLDATAGARQRWPVKSVVSPMLQPCFVQLCRRWHAQRMCHSILGTCMLCSCAVSVTVMHAAQQQHVGSLHLGSTCAKGAKTPASQLLRVASSQTVHIFCLFGFGRKVNKQ